MDECLAGNGGCAQICNNTEGSFECLCNAGYILTANNLDCDGKLSNHAQLLLKMLVKILYRCG